MTAAITPSLGPLITDLRLLAAVATEALAKDRLVSYQDYLARFNRLLDQAKSNGLAQDVEPIAQVPFGRRAAHSAAEQAKLREVKLACRHLLARLPQPIAPTESAFWIREPEELIMAVFARFHLFVRQLQTRHEDRATLDVRDEYDVQDLMHAVLRLFFDDVRAEGCTRRPMREKRAAWTSY
jgi:hypothetical protein